MEKKWKLMHAQNRGLIVNENGKTIGYFPGSGIRILESDGYAFKDMNDNGIIDAFEDWRLPLCVRAKDFALLFHLTQHGESLFVDGKEINFPQEFNLEQLYMMICDQHVLEEYPYSMDHLSEAEKQYINDNYLFILFILMIDDSHGNDNDYMIQFFMQSTHEGITAHISYSIGKALKEFMVGLLKAQPAM